MKRKIYIALCAVLLAAPATARALDWEVKDVTHTITATVGENSFTVDGEEIPLPKDMEVYKKDGYVMLPAEPLLDLLEKDVKSQWYREEGGPITALAGVTILQFDTEKNEMYRNGSKVELSGSLEILRGEIFLPLRGWRAALEGYGYAAGAMTWDSRTQTASFQFSGQELERKKLPEQTPVGKGAEPEYILKPTRKYERITNMGDGYFSAEIGSVSIKHDILDSAGKVCQSYGEQFDMEYLGENRFLVRDYNNREDKVADENGETIFSMEGSYMEPFSEGLAEVSLRNGAGFGFVDVNGEMVIPAKFGETEPFSEGLAAVCPQTLMSGEPNYWENWGYIDKSGKFVIPAKYEACKPFREGLAAVKSGGKWGYIDKTGREVIPPQFGWAGYFYDGMAFVQEKNAERSMSTWVIDKAGKKQEKKLNMKGNGLYYVYRDDPRLYTGVMRTEEIVEYTGGHAHLASYYDADGEISGERLEWFTKSAEGLMAFQDEETGKYGYVDEEYNWVIAPVFDRAEDFMDGYAVVYNKTKQGTATIDSEWGVIKRPQNLPLQ
ncbi:MAG: hypothetical protein HFE60_02475 [Anaerotignum sp.]|nr:hypothetical protein [Anaerotignum sp.]